MGYHMVAAVSSSNRWTSLQQFINFLPLSFTSSLPPNHKSRGVRPGQRDKKLSGSALTHYCSDNKTTLRGSCALERATGNKSKHNYVNTSNGIRTRIFPCYSTFSKAVGLREKYSVMRKLMCAKWATKAICSWGGLCVQDYGVIRHEAPAARARDWHQSMLYIDRSSLLCTACHHEWFVLSRSAVDSSFVSVFVSIRRRLLKTNFSLWRQ